MFATSRHRSLVKKFLTKRKHYKNRILLVLNIMFAFLVYHANKKSYYYLFDSVKLPWFDSTLAELSLEGLSLCPREHVGTFCPTPCWRGESYEEPEFTLTPNCTVHSQTDLLIYVYSALDNFESRNEIREKFRTELKNEHNITAVLFFILGAPAYPKLEVINKQVHLEHKAHNDILQMTIKDTYKHLAFKGLSAFKWVGKCRKSNGKQYVLKIDDDSLTLVTDMETLLMTAKEIFKRHNEVKDDLICLFVMYEVLTYEPKKKYKWESTFHQYFSRKYPHYCNGVGGMFLTPQVAQSLYEAGRGLPVFHLDDNYISGFLRERACLKIRDWSGVYPFLESLMYTFLNFYSYEEWMTYSYIRSDFDRKDKNSKNITMINWQYFTAE